MKKIAVTFILLNLFTTTLFAKAKYYGKTDMIEISDAIAIIKIIKTEDAKKIGKHWSYGQKAIGTVEKTLKGNIRGDIEIYGDENFICASCQYKKGRFLLFLRKDDGFWVGVNWNLGIRQIKDGKIDWFKNESVPFDIEKKFLEGVIQEIVTVVKSSKFDSPEEYLKDKRIKEYKKRKKENEKRRKELESTYIYTDEVMKLATKGYLLFKEKKYANSFKGGYYTDPDPETHVYDFWSDGRIAKVDRHGTGHHETFFIIVEDKLIYFGCVGIKNKWIDAGKSFEDILKTPNDFDLIYKHQKRMETKEQK